MLSPDPELMQAFDFSVTDLTANREGKITAYQMNHLRENLSDKWFALGCLPVVGFMCFLCWATVRYMSPGRRGPMPVPYVALLGVLIVVGIIVLCIGAIYRNSAEANNPRVQSVHGQMRIIIRYLRPHEIGGAPIQLLQIGYVTFGLKPSQYKILSEYLEKADELKIYKLYYTVDSKTILSIEALS